jgi:hypothetical protein
MMEEDEEEVEVGGGHCSSIQCQPVSRRRTGACSVSLLASLLVLSLLPIAGSIPIGKGKPRAVGSAEAWRPPASFPGLVFPEQMDNDAGGRGMLAGRYKSAVCFSGGGLRSFIASIGYLAALEDLGLMDEIGYTTGVSGGSWATVLYSYYKRCVVGRLRCHHKRSISVFLSIYSPTYLSTFSSLSLSLSLHLPTCCNLHLSMPCSCSRSSSSPPQYPSFTRKFSNCKTFRPASLTLPTPPRATFSRRLFLNTCSTCIQLSTVAFLNADPRPPLNDGVSAHHVPRGSDGIAKTDSELLGEVPLPENITMAWLKRIPPRCARRSAATGLLKEILAQVMFLPASLLSLGVGD